MDNTQGVPTIENDNLTCLYVLSLKDVLNPR
jgi:hypothetical protein